MSKIKDAYDLATEIQKLWQTAAIGFNNASDIKKNWGEVPLVVKVNDEYLQVDEMTDYAFSKFISEKYCLNSNLNSITSVRFSTIFYANENKDGISKLIFDCVNKN